MPETPRTNWILIAAIFVAGLFAAAQFGKLTLTLEVMQSAYPDASAWVPTLISIVGVVGVVFGVIAGPFSARLGLERVLLVSLLGGAVMSLIQTTLPPVEIFTLTRVVEGFSQLGIVISGPTLIAAACRAADRPVAMGLWASFFGASFAITAAILPSLLAAGGLPLLFLSHGIGTLVIAAILWTLLPKSTRNPSELPGFVAAYRTLYTTPNLLLPGAGFVWYTAIYIALIGVLPITMDLAANTIATIPLVSIAGTIGAGFVAKLIGPQYVSNIGFATSAAVMLVIAAGWTDSWILYSLFFVMGAIPTGAFAAIAYFNETTETQARATGGITHFGNIGTTLGTPLMVLAFQGAGMAGVTAMVILCCVGGVVSLVALSRKTS